VLTLKGAFSENDRLVPLMDGTVRAKGVEIQWETFESPGKLFAKQMRDNTFDVFEFSISDYVNIQSRPTSAWDWTAIPIFLSKALLQLNTWVNVNSGVTGAERLTGKKLAVGDYTQTAFVWFRAMIERLYGVQSQDIAWYNGRGGQESHSVLLGLQSTPPPGVSITFLEDLEAIDGMLQSGALDAANATSIPIDIRSSNVRPLFPDRGKDFMETFYRSVGFTPVNHTVAIQRRLVEKSPWLPEALYEAIENSKQEAYRRNPLARRIVRERDGLNWDGSSFGTDPYVSGLSANQAMLTMAVEQLLKDGLIQNTGEVKKLFWESVQKS
jgi:4,5-dihydroxyphthalate decarboxylase